MSEIALTASVRNQLLNLQTTSDLMAKTQGRLATGNKVNSALDNPMSFFASQALTNRATDLTNRVDAMGQGVSTLKAADQGLKSITKLVDQMNGLITSARSADTATRSTLATQFDTLRTQIDQLITDTGYNGTNLLNGNNLTVNFNEDSSSNLAITGVTYNSAGLGLTAAANSWAATADIDAAATTVTTALSTLRAQAATFGTNLGIVESRLDFTKNMVTTLKEGAGKLTLADTNEEAANLLALQTRQQLGTTSLSMANQTQQAILRLF
jgi:flagellin